MPQLTALLAGATGLVGRACLRRLLDHPDYAKVVAVVRRPLDLKHPRLETVVSALDGLDALAVRTVTHAFCALGTTIAKAGSEAAFRQVDHDAVLAFARLARRHGATQFVLVSSIGADPASSNFYLRVKGETERDLAAIGFAGTHLLRPGLLLGDREESRPAEALARTFAPWLNPLLVGGLRRYRSVEADAVAAAMIGAALEGASGARVVEFDDIERLAAAASRRRP
jgi:uncharacterized protein YbjT (DUF2867 family)